MAFFRECGKFVAAACIVVVGLVSTGCVDSGVHEVEGDVINIVKDDTPWNYIKYLFEIVQADGTVLTAKCRDRDVAECPLVRVNSHVRLRMGKKANYESSGVVVLSIESRTILGTDITIYADQSVPR